jgi:hypothetical protein
MATPPPSMGRDAGSICTALSSSATISPHCSRAGRLGGCQPGSAGHDSSAVAAISYGSAQRSEGTRWCTRHVKCKRAAVQNALAGDVSQHTAHGVYVELAKHLSGCALLSVLRSRKPPPPPPRKRVKRPRRGKRS